MAARNIYGVLRFSFFIHLISLAIAQSRTGMEVFDLDEFQLNFDMSRFSSDRKTGIHKSKIIRKSDTFSVLELVQDFIKSLKGVSGQNLKTNNRRTCEETTFAKPDWLFDPYKLKNLVVDELSIFKTLKKISLEKGVTSKLLQSYIADFEDTTLKAISYFEARKVGSDKTSEEKYMHVASHPFLVYRMIRRFAEDLKPILLQLDIKSSDFPVDMKFRDTQIFPNATDLLDALESIYRIQHGNMLSTFWMANGILEKVNTGIKLTALNSLELGAFYLTKEHYDLALEWLYVAVEDVQQNSKTQKYPKVLNFFRNILDMAINEHNKDFTRKANDRDNPRHFVSRVISPFDPKSNMKGIDYLKRIATNKMKDTRWNWPLWLNSKRLCSGERLQSDKENANLSCWYDTSRNPYWLINPLKMELLHKKPDVLQIYDVIGDQLIDKMKAIASKQLSRSTIVDGSNPSKKFEINKSRTSSQVWIDEYKEDGKFMGALSRKLELLSGLRIVPYMASDMYQVALYGSSHHYDVHLDAFPGRNPIKQIGNRLTTIMGYLSSVEIGGRTVFPVLGIAAKPVKGSILMWNNMKRNGVERDRRVFHGGCPVVLGIKWITNKWVHSDENMFNYQCTLNSNE